MTRPDHASSAPGTTKAGTGGRKTQKRDAPHVETYQLPRWDAQGRPVSDPKANKPEPSSVEDVNPQSLKPPTADDIRQIHEDAYNEGFESGFEQGMKQGQATGQGEGYKAGYDSGEQEGLSAGNKAGMLAAQQAEEERLNAELAPLGDLLTQIKEVLEQQTGDLQSGLVALATRIARNVIDAELALAPDHIQNLVHAAVQALPNADERFTLELNPEDEALVKQIAEPHWNLVPTPSVSRGGCIIRTRFSYVDYSLEHRYRQQVSNLLAHAGLSEHLMVMESPWPLPAAETNASVADDETAQADDTNTGESAPADAGTPESEPPDNLGSEARHADADATDADLSQTGVPPTEAPNPPAPDDEAPQAQRDSDTPVPEADTASYAKSEESAPGESVRSGEPAAQPETQSPDQTDDPAAQVTQPHSENNK